MKNWKLSALLNTPLGVVIVVGFHHRHFMGVVEPIEFKSFEDIEERFQSDWITFRSKK